jgi:DNA polymerase I
MKHLVLIDGHHLMYRAYWAIPRALKTGSGEQVNAVFGVASMMLHILKIEQPDHLVVCFDAGEKTFRHQENETYKDGRAETPDDFYVQIPRIMQLVEAFGFRQVAHSNYEADDFLCAYSKAGEKEDMRVTIVTGDRDAFQLASDKTKVAIPHSGYLKAEYLGPAEIEAKYGVRPDQIVDYKGLTGDPSDNLPGVNGIGPVTAAKLLQDYQTLDGIYEHLAEIRPAVRAKLEADREQAYFCQHMAQLVCDFDLPVSLEEARIEGLPADGLIQFFREMEFTLLTRRLRDFLASPYGQKSYYTVSEVFADPVAAKKGPSENQMAMF